MSKNLTSIDYTPMQASSELIYDIYDYIFNDVYAIITEVDKK